MLLRFSLLTILALTAATSACWAQTAVSQQNTVGPDPKRAQIEFAQWSAQDKVLHAQAQAALSADQAREQAGECAGVSSTREQEECLQSAMEKTEANVSAFSGAIRLLLALRSPTVSGPQQAASGPTGKPLSSSELVLEFDRNEAESQKFRQDEAKAAFDQYKGGTLAPVFQSETEQRLLRLHMQELALIYDWATANR